MKVAGPFDLVIFDLDGTLVDSVPDIAWSLNTTLVEAGLSSLSVRTVTEIVGDGAGKLVERAIGAQASGHDPQALLARFVTHYADHLCVDSRLYPGVADLLDSLASSGIATAVVTNKPHALAQRLLNALAIAEHFSTTIGEGHGFPRKPDPSAALSIIGRTGVSPDRTIIVGDGLADIGMSRAIPCPVIAAAWGYVSPARLQQESPTFLASSLKEAAAILLPPPIR
jgi:phosphoglycolate phosphatase